MSTKNWDKIAENEFQAMDQTEQNAWADLRNRVG